MANVVQTITNLTVENQTFYDRALLERCLPELPLYDDAQKKKFQQERELTLNGENGIV